MNSLELLNGQNGYIIFGIFLFVIAFIYTKKEFEITSDSEKAMNKVFTKPTREELRRKIKKRRKRIITSIQTGIIAFTKDEYLSYRKPLGIASEVRFKNGNLKEMWCYTIEFKNDKFKIEFIAQIRANMTTIMEQSKGNKKKKELLSYVDQTKHHPEIFKGPHDIKCECSIMKLKHILNFVDEIRNQHEGRTDVC